MIAQAQEENRWNVTDDQRCADADHHKIGRRGADEFNVCFCELEGERLIAGILPCASLGRTASFPPGERLPAPSL